MAERRAIKRKLLELHPDKARDQDETMTVRDINAMLTDFLQKETRPHVPEDDGPSLKKMLAVALKSARNDIIFLDRIMRHTESWHRFRLESNDPCRIVACLEGNLWTRDQARRCVCPSAGCCQGAEPTLRTARTRCAVSSGPRW